MGHVKAYSRTMDSLRMEEHYLFGKIVNEKLVELLPRISNEVLTRAATACRNMYRAEKRIVQDKFAALITPQIQEACKERGKYVSFIKAIVEATASYDPSEERREAAKLLLFITHKYRKVQTRAFMEETGWLWAMLGDLGTPERVVALALLNLEQAVQALREQNELVERLCHKRGKSYKEKLDRGLLKNARRQVDKAFGNVTTSYLNALALTAPPGTPSCAAQEELIDFINAQCGEFARSPTHRKKKLKVES